MRAKTEPATKADLEKLSKEQLIKLLMGGYYFYSIQRPLTKYDLDKIIQQDGEDSALAKMKQSMNKDGTYNHDMFNHALAELNRHIKEQG